jgi:hypothetical protein
MFSAEFQKFKVAESPSDLSSQNLPTLLLSDVSELAPVMDISKSQDVLKAMLDWVATNEAEAVGAVMGLFSGVNGSDGDIMSSLLKLVANHSGATDQLSEEGVLAMTLLASLCAQFKQKQEGQHPVNSSSSLPLLSLLHLLLQTKKEIQCSSHIQPFMSTFLDVLTTLINSLIPATARLTAVTSRHRTNVSQFERDTAVQMMDMIEACS